MSTYFKMMAGTDVAQAKMAAYALYMLNRDDPAMAVSVLLAGASGEGGSKAPKHFLMDVLKDLASRDKKFRQSLQKIVATSDSTGVDTEAQVRAYEVIESVSVKPPPAEVAAGEEQKKQENQWCYLGRFRSNRWSDSSLKIKTNQEVKVGQYELVKDVRLRAGYPKKPDYKLAKTVGVAHKGSRVEIKKLKYVGTGVWAKVSIVE